MKTKTSFFLLLAGMALLQSCGVFRPKYGCPSDGRNAGAENLLSNPPKKVKKFKA